jgi:hypothetical protein
MLVENIKKTVKENTGIPFRVFSDDWPGNKCSDNNVFISHHHNE